MTSTTLRPPGIPATDPPAARRGRSAARAERLWRASPLT